MDELVVLAYKHTTSFKLKVNMFRYDLLYISFDSIIFVLDTRLDCLDAEFEQVGVTDSLNQ